MEPLIGLEIIIVMIKITILSATTMVETAVDQMLTHSGVKYVYVWRITQRCHLQQSLQPQVQLTLHLQQKTQQQVLPSI